MSDIFLSYKKEDFNLADRIVTALRAEGMSVWWDDSLTPQQDWDESIEREIAAAAAVLVLWTPHSVTSEWVRREAHYGQDRGKLVPVMVETATIPIAFTLNQTVSLEGWDGNRDNRQWRKLLIWITDLVSTKPGNANIPGALPAATTNRFREAVGKLPSGEDIFDGELVNASTPAGTLFRDGDHLPVMRIIPKGSFLLGATYDDPDHDPFELPQKRIDIPIPFAIGIFPLLIGEYQKVSELPKTLPAPSPMESRGWFGTRKAASPPPAAPSYTNPRIPVSNVSFDDAQEFVRRLSSSGPANYRIPSEAEWEYCCRAGTRTRYFFGDQIDSSKAAFALLAGPVEAGSFPPNSFGLYEMHGNVREWTADLWHESYDLTPSDGRPIMEGHSSMRVVRGGGWSDSAPRLRSAARMRATQSVRANVIGFRVVRTLS